MRSNLPSGRRFSACSRRSGLLCSCGAARPLMHVKPSNSGFSRSPVSETARPWSSTSTTTPQELWHVRQMVGVVVAITCGSGPPPDVHSTLADTD